MGINSVLIRTTDAQAVKVATPTERSVARLSRSNHQASVISQMGSDENNLQKLLDSKLSAYRSESQPPYGSNPHNNKDNELPDGTYPADLDARYIKTKRGTPSFRLRFTIAEGDYTGLTVWKDLYLTPKAINYSLQHLLELGLDSFEAIRTAVITGLRCEITVITEVSFDGDEQKVVDSFVVDGSASLVNPVCPPTDDDDDSDSDDLLI